MTKGDGRAHKSSKNGKNSKIKKIRKDSWPVRKVIETLTKEDRAKIDDIYRRKKKTNRGRKGFSPHALFLAILLMYLKRLDSVEELVRFLKLRKKWLKRLNLKRTVGNRKKYVVPDRTTFIKFLERAEDILPEIFMYLVARLVDKRIITGRALTIDATIIKAWVKNCIKRSKSKKKRKYSDKDAKWGYCSSKEMWIYGYKVTILADVDSGLPIALTITPANKAEGKQFETLVRLAYENFDFETEEFMGDAAFDYNKIRKMIVTEIEAKPIIDINPRNCKGKTKEEKKERRKKLLKKWYRKEFIYKYYVDPDGKEFDEKYDQRTVSERINSTSKESLRLDDLKFRGKKKAKSHVYISFIGMLAVALTAERIGRPDLIRCVKCFTV